jgi:hypothetical protein
MRNPFTNPLAGDVFRVPEAPGVEPSDLGVLAVRDGIVHGVQVGDETGRVEFHAPVEEFAQRLTDANAVVTRLGRPENEDDEEDLPL